MGSSFETFSSTLEDRIVIVRFVQWLGSTQRRVCECPEGEWTPIEYPMTRLLDKYFDVDIKDVAGELRELSPEAADELLRRENADRDIQA